MTTQELADKVLDCVWLPERTMCEKTSRYVYRPHCDRCLIQELTRDTLRELFVKSGLKVPEKPL